MLTHRRTSFIVLLFSFVLAAAAAQDAATRAGGRAFRILAPKELRQGDPLLAWVSALPATDAAAPTPPLEARLVDAAGKEIEKARCFDASSMPGAPPGAPLFGVLMALPTDLAPGTFAIEAGTFPNIASSSLVVLARAFPLEKIPLDEANTAIRTVPSKRKDDEARRLFALLEKTDDAAVFADGSPFLFPVEGGFRSAGFGDRRRYIYSKGEAELSVHAGLDWAVVKGTVVRACERGKVVLVADREVTGWTVVIEHLPGLYSLYFHLSSVEAKEGAIVERGERIALSGSTGMSTGPHLHWELRAKGEAVDPQYWLGPALLDKEAIKATITALIEGR
jgi:murein DD-endopeptidase MepM/ murein hydrolase activator NlpD